MRLAVLSGFEYAGGGNVAATRLSRALSSLGVQVTRIMTGRRELEGERYDLRTLRPMTALPLPVRAAFKCVRLAGFDTRGARERVYNRSVARDLRQCLQALQPDVINVHSLLLNGSPRLVSLCERFAPTVWTLHDMWSFTGGCTCSLECRAFRSGCTEECPMAEDASLRVGRIRAAWDERRLVISGSRRLVGVSPSQWLRDLAQQGHWHGNRVSVIRNCLNLEVFTPRDRLMARRELGLPSSGTVLAAASGNLDAPLKGMNLLRKALRDIVPTLENCILVTAGPGCYGSDWDGLPIRRLGMVSTDTQMARVLNAADLVVHPSLAESFSYVAAESLACGTPVLAFGVGAIPELVVPGVTGWLAGEPSADALSITLRQALAALSSGLNLRDSCRQFAERQFDPKARAREYLSLFEELTGC